MNGPRNFVFIKVPVLFKRDFGNTFASQCVFQMKVVRFVIPGVRD